MAASSSPALGLLAYLNQPHERANEDLAVGYFRSLFGEAFQRQREAQKADGYVPGAFVLELKGRSTDWLAGLFQALAYQNEGLDFAQIVVAAHGFLAVWQISELPSELRLEMAAASGAPSRIGREFAKRHNSLRSDLLRRATWNGADLTAPLFRDQPTIMAERLASFEEVLKSGKRTRQRVTLRNFTTVLREMAPFFESSKPVGAVRAFYSMVYSWHESSIVQISARAPDQATLGGEIVVGLKPSARAAFKDFVEARCIILAPEASFDDFFARYDEALDAVDPDFRRRHGIFFTDLHLSKLAMWLAKQYIPSLGHDFLVVDPACGSGNLVTNWRSPLELRHKVVSEIEPELLFAVEQRMKGDLWHNGRFTVVPRVSENRGLNFLDRSAADYLEELRVALAEKGHSPDKPLAILCNPPFRSDDDQSAGSVAYTVHSSITALTGPDAASERYCCFLAQMKMVCETALASGLPGESLLLLFSKSAWLTNRAIFRQIRSEMAGAFENVAGVLVDGSEFFDVRGRWPVAFTIWRYKGQEAKLDAGRSIEIIDLTWLRRRDLEGLPWSDVDATDIACQKLLADARAQTISLGHNRRSMRLWSGQSMTDFKRDRRRSELEQSVVGGLPAGDRRLSNRKAYGERDGVFVGFMDDLTPCRVKRAAPGKPWFRLNSQFMDVKKNRCLSGPPTHWGYCATDVSSARKLFFWYSLARTFVQQPYPMWADAEDLWEPTISPQRDPAVFALCAAIVFAENECVETFFPANNPMRGVREVYVTNPLTPLNPDSFWSKEIEPNLEPGASPIAATLIASVKDVFRSWDNHLGTRSSVPVSYASPYFVDDRPLTRASGLIQIRDYASFNEIESLTTPLSILQSALRSAKIEFHNLVTSDAGLNYFGAIKTLRNQIDIPARTSFERVAARRLAVSGLLVKALHNERHFGRTKLAKLFYLADRHADLSLETNYVREAAGPLDSRALYHGRVGIEALAKRHRLFESFDRGQMTRYKPSSALAEIDELAKTHLGEKIDEVLRIIDVCRSLTTDQAEIIATLHACWNDLLRNGLPSDDEILRDFSENWHPQKKRFANARLLKALTWMRAKSLVPSGRAPKTRAKTLK